VYGKGYYFTAYEEAFKTYLFEQTCIPAERVRTACAKPPTGD